ncbi:hypothetical protein [Arachidicoccus ginsenosidivorans]|nr:hypothetical protein [Arachidicoccus ginsenosidivorans]
MNSNIFNKKTGVDANASIIMAIDPGSIKMGWAVIKVAPGNTPLN